MAFIERDVLFFVYRRRLCWYKYSLTVFNYLSATFYKIEDCKNMRSRSHHHFYIWCIWMILCFEQIQRYSAESSTKHDPRPGPILSLTQGKIQGTILTTDAGTDYVAFKGIPYATQKRFQKAGPPPPWVGVRDASNFGSPCPQMSFTTGKPEGDEDCLFINVATPISKSDRNEKDGSSDNPKLRPTIVYIHGGGFHSGSGGQSGPDYWMDNGEVVFVTFNYRLGPFGFLNLGNDKENDVAGIEPNLGLKDQTAALTWVQQNIEAFGGMKENLTLFGGSAGAAGVSFHILSDMSTGLFSKAISGSGSALCPWALDPNPGMNARLLIKHVGCDVPAKGESNGDGMLKKCLLEKPFQDFLGIKSPQAELWSLDPAAMFQPSVEKSSSLSSSTRSRFLKDSPTSLLATGKFNKVPWISGVTNQEGLALHSAIILNNPAMVENLNHNWDTIAPITLSLNGIVPEENMRRVVTKIRNFYFGVQEISAKDPVTSTKLQELYSDRNFFTGVRDSILLHAKKAPVYPYMFDYMDPNAQSWLTTVLGLNISGVAHGDDFAYYFKFYMDPTDPNSGLALPPNTSATEMSQKLIKLFVGFAKNGIPEVWEDQPWTKSSKERNSMKWFHIDNSPTEKVESENFKARMDFWSEIIFSGPESLSNTEHSEL